MDLMPYVERLRRELAVAADAGGDDARELADRLVAPLESATRLTLLEALSTAAAEITSDLAPGSVHLRLNGLDPDFVVTPPPAETPRLDDRPPTPVAAPTNEPPPTAGDSGTTTRINLRLPDDVKARVERAAAQEHISVNAWLVRAAVAALEPRPGGPATYDTGARRRGVGDGRSYTGWAR